MIYVDPIRTVFRGRRGYWGEGCFLFSDLHADELLRFLESLPNVGNRLLGLGLEPVGFPVISITNVVRYRAVEKGAKVVSNAEAMEIFRKYRRRDYNAEEKAMMGTEVLNGSR